MRIMVIRMLSHATADDTLQNEYCCAVIEMLVSLNKQCSMNRESSLIKDDQSRCHVDIHA